ncbi:MAG: aspartate--tRNA ligase [Candidatus Portnoybacteria bacterium]|nr:aspartate--tRNA ligase [Candidatus Portnoybacteria bacterium]
MERINILKTTEYAGKKVKVCGWVHSRRDHGKLIFIDLRDRSGLLQVVFSGELYEKANKLRSEWVVEIEGVVNERPKGMINDELATGQIEMKAERLEILNKSETPPFEVSEGSEGIKEEIRLKYRYLDLRTERMKNNIVLRHKVVKLIRDYLDEKEFLEIETPVLTKSTPEGARDFLVPSRLHLGEFYALPQAPQQLKQLLMVAGLEKYFQIARCFRDEDLRGDRQPEFTQLDFEMSFPSQEEIMEIIEELMIKIAELAGKKLTFKPFKILTYKECMDKYKTDSPDLRKDKNDPDELAFAWVVDWPLFEWNKEEKRYDPMHHIFTSPKEEDIGLLEKEPLKVRSWQHDLVCNGHEIAGGSIRNHDPKIQKKIFEFVGLSEEEINNKFGHLLRAFEYGAPPHGGIAMGIDRLLMILAGEDSIREVIAFPKTGDGRDLTMEAPSDVSEKQLKELGIKIRKKD